MGPSGLVGLVIWDVPALSAPRCRPAVDPTTTAPVVPLATSDAAEGLVADGDAARVVVVRDRDVRAFPFPAAGRLLSLLSSGVGLGMEMEAGLDGACTATVQCFVLIHQSSPD